MRVVVFSIASILLQFIAAASHSSPGEYDHHSRFTGNGDGMVVVDDDDDDDE